MVGVGAALIGGLGGVSYESRAEDVIQFSGLGFKRGFKRGVQKDVHDVCVIYDQSPA